LRVAGGIPQRPATLPNPKKDHESQKSKNRTRCRCDDVCVGGVWWRLHLHDISSNRCADNECSADNGGLDNCAANDPGNDDYVSHNGRPGPHHFEWDRRRRARCGRQGALRHDGGRRWLRGMPRTRRNRQRRACFARHSWGRFHHHRQCPRGTRPDDHPGPERRRHQGGSRVPGYSRPGCLTIIEIHSCGGRQSWRPPSSWLC